VLEDPRQRPRSRLAVDDQCQVGRALGRLPLGDRLDERIVDPTGGVDAKSSSQLGDDRRRIPGRL